MNNAADAYEQAVRAAHRGWWDVAGLVAGLAAVVAWLAW